MKADLTGRHPGIGSRRSLEPPPAGNTCRARPISRRRGGWTGSQALPRLTDYAVTLAEIDVDVAAGDDSDRTNRRYSVSNPEVSNPERLVERIIFCPLVKRLLHVRGGGLFSVRSWTLNKLP